MKEICRVTGDVGYITKLEFIQDMTLKKLTGVYKFTTDGALKK